MKKLVVLFLLAIANISFAQVVVKNLLTENLTNPIGLDEKLPRFSWQLSSDMRNSSQNAYEIKVSAGKTAVWNSGKIVTSQSVHVPYAGTALQSGKKYSWQVRVWDNTDKLSAWSEVASFQMALLEASDWKAKWIEAGFVEDSINRPVQYFRKQFNSNKKIANATAYITSRGMYEAQINGKRVGDFYLTPGWTNYNKRLQYQVYDVTSLLANGKNAIGVMVGNGWYRGFLAWQNNKDIYGKKLALLFQLNITYSDGSVETIVSDDSWKSSNGAIRYSEIYHGETIDAREDKTGWSTEYL